MSIMKKILSQHKAAWLQELPGVLWSYHTTPRVSTGQTSFSLIYGLESVLLSDVGMKQHFAELENQAMIEFDLATIDELKELAEIKMERYK